MNERQLPSGYLGFQVTRMIEGFLGVWNFQFQDFFRVGNLGRNFFGWLGSIREFWGYSKQTEDLCSDGISWPHTSAKLISTTKLVFQNFIFHLISFNAFWKFLRLGNSAWDFFSVFFFFYCWWGRGEIFGPEIFLGFDFCPHSIIQVN